MDRHIKALGSKKMLLEDLASVCWWVHDTAYIPIQLVDRLGDWLWLKGEGQ